MSSSVLEPYIKSTTKLSNSVKMSENTIVLVHDFGRLPKSYQSISEQDTEKLKKYKGIFIVSRPCTILILNI